MSTARLTICIGRSVSRWRSMPRYVHAVLSSAMPVILPSVEMRLPPRHSVNPRQPDDQLRHGPLFGQLSVQRHSLIPLARLVPTSWILRRQLQALIPPFLRPHQRPPVFSPLVSSPILRQRIRRILREQLRAARILRLLRSFPTERSSPRRQNIHRETLGSLSVSQLDVPFSWSSSSSSS